ncbi:long-chain fatty acid--CoA ligase [Saccharopolyspora erythraea]|uniref:AMP-dependent synthetase/ligase n=1 Tax=Saccharopolyspora erythraea TaxID=1836 RepID=UPI001BA77DF0|nr:long-chain fatty acid--CoA ligase [Saccharopolyspora erythraea]QUH04411.1 long-chain fatty acid--CoA ligase [Saccharopolyspora erythraea]
MEASTQTPTGVERRPASVGRMFLDRVADTPDLEAYRFPRGDRWESVTWAQAADRVAELAAGLLTLGIGPQERVAIASGTRYEWVLADLAIMCAGAATTTVYPSTVSSEVAYILSDSGSRIVFAEDDEQIAKLREHRDELGDVCKVVTFDGTPDGDWVISLAELEDLGGQLLSERPDVVRERVEATAPDALATVIYTSGTTGAPKGVRLLHSAWTYEGWAVAEQGIVSADDLQYFWLPMAHAFGKVLMCAQLAVGFATAIDGRIDRLVDNLAVVRPTVMGAAPRIFEKAHARVVTMAAGEGGVKKKIFDWAFDVGRRVSRLRQAKQPVPPRLAMAYKVADRLVFTKIRERFGGRIRFFISGSAPLDPQIAEWFDAAGVLILEGYGLTETSAGTSINRPGNYRFGTIGEPLPGTEMRIAEDGEILIKGPGVMSGYHHRETETAETLDADGWLHTGDIGERDPDGLIRITDRKKDLFKTSGGKYIAPTAIEGRFKAICPYVSQFLVHGPGRNYCTALLTLDEETIVPWARDNGLDGRSYAEIVSSAEVRDLVQDYVDQLNAGLNRWETIKSFTILTRDLSIEDGELTPSLKVKRRVVEERNQDALDGMYSS